MRIYANEFEYIAILEKAHARLAKGNFPIRKTTTYILMERIWWPTLFNGAIEYVKACDECQCTKRVITNWSSTTQSNKGSQKFGQNTSDSHSWHVRT